MPCDKLIFDMLETSKKKDSSNEIISVARVKEGGGAVLSNGRPSVHVGSGIDESKL